MIYNIKVIFSKTKILLSILLILSIFAISRITIKASEIGLQDADIAVTTIPENPQPYENVTIKLTSYATDLNKAFIEWRNGRELLISGYGKTIYSFVALGPDTVIDFFVTITPPDSSDKLTKQITINPSEIEIMWEGVDSYTPPFYRGKSFPSREGLIKAIAIPTSNTIKQGSGKISYSWKNNDNAVLGSSGYNKNSYTFTNSKLNTRENVTVVASSIDGKYNATKTINIPIVNPSIIFYKKSPTEGILYNNALTDGTFVSGEEITLVAEPYFLSTKNNNNLDYQWQINGTIIDTPSKKSQLTVRPTSRGGYATINLIVENINVLFQKVSKTIKLDL